VLGGGAVAAFFGAVGAEVFRVRGGPAVGTQRGVVGAAGQQPVEHVLGVAESPIKVLPETVQLASATPNKNLTAVFGNGGGGRVRTQWQSDQGY